MIFFNLDVNANHNQFIYLINGNKSPSLNILLLELTICFTGYDRRHGLCDTFSKEIGADILVYSITKMFLFFFNFCKSHKVEQ